ncbi:penicillin-binding protein 1C [Phyllobacterium phragmitis]|uniref:penicillin-binding protein 1C n=1 Tax=Phyllobacterium phragmitis TaxID=2670329 RepID=UPI001FE08DFA|nr:penicillin-binding protein 1C [Phyllobacterium phragmitis]
MNRSKIAVLTAAALITTIGAAAAGLLALDRLYPPPLDAARSVSAEVVGRNGHLLRAFAAAEGRWRLKTGVDDVDPRFIKMLVAYEDRRFWSHPGVDPLALLRAAGQLVTNGRIVSGGSTLSMQLARLIEPRAERSIGAKLLQMARAIQIERRLSKREILEHYLTLAPYGGNLEGVRAASLAWFGKAPRRLTLAEAALLVALPQLPEKRRPDRNLAGARAARDRVLERMASTGTIDAGEIERAAAEAVPSTRRALPALAAHLANDAVRKDRASRLHKVTLDRNVQQGLENVARAAAANLGPKLSVAMILADAGTGEILGEVGSADYFDGSRSGWIDMTRIARSPGSALKPFIYGLAFEDGLVMQETVIEDRPASFSGYRPRNFDMSYQGDVSVREALQLSLNVPAVRLLDAVGPTRLMVRFRRAGVNAQLPPGEAPGLAIGLGGVGMTLKDLVQLYAGLANGGKVVMLREHFTATEKRSRGSTPLCPAGHLPLKGGDYVFINARHQSQTSQNEGGELCQPISPLEGEMPGRAEGGAPSASIKSGTAQNDAPQTLLTPAAAWQVSDILSGVLPPKGSFQRGIAYKTGTSYGYRDAWSVGFDGRYVLGVWVGRADNAAVPGLTGYGSAAPILFEGFAKSGLAITPLPRAPAGAVRIARSELPPSLRRFSQNRLVTTGLREPAPQIVYPPEGARVELMAGATGETSPLVLKLQGGRAPFRWLANGTPLPEASRRRTTSWQPDGAGYSTLTVIDAAGRAASVRVFVN